MKTLILLVALLAVVSSNLARSHKYWYTAEKALVKTGVPFADFAWNYCDLKCLYFEHYIKATDFVYIDFSAGFFKPNFAACFIRTVLANGTANYALWNTDTVAANNTWYNTYCGGDTADYYAQSQGSGAAYSVLGVQGIGIGNYPVY